MRRAQKQQINFVSLTTGIGFLVVTAIMVTVPWLVLSANSPVRADLTPSPTANRLPASQPTESPTLEPSEDLEAPSPTEEGLRVHVVQPGDSLYKIAESYGTTVEAISAANGITDPRRLSVGQELVIP